MKRHLILFLLALAFLHVGFQSYSQSTFKFRPHFELLDIDFTGDSLYQTQALLWVLDSTIEIDSIEVTLISGVDSSTVIKSQIHAFNTNRFVRIYDGSKKAKIEIGELTAGRYFVEIDLIGTSGNRTGIKRRIYNIK